MAEGGDTIYIIRFEDVNGNHILRSVYGTKAEVQNLGERMAKEQGWKIMVIA